MTPIKPILRPLRSSICDFLYVPSMVGSLRWSILATSMLVLTFFKNGTTPSTPWSNSWLPKVCSWKHSCRKHLYNYYSNYTHHNISWQHIQKLTCHIPSANIIPQCSLKTIACIYVNRVWVFLLLQQLFHGINGARIAANAFLAGITSTTRFIGCFVSVFKRKSSLSKIQTMPSLAGNHNLKLFYLWIYQWIINKCI